MVALVPVQDPGTGKSRLSGALSAERRAALTGAMLADVATALHAGPVDQIVVAASGPEAGALAGSLGLDVLLDPPSARGIDDAVRVAAGRIGNVGTLIVVMADLPRLHPDDVTKLVETDAQVVVAPTTDGGTGALLRRPPSIIETAYGPDSAGRHARMGHRAGATTVVADLPGFRSDVDTWEDLAALRSGFVGRFTSAFVAAVADRFEQTG